MSSDNPTGSFHERDGDATSSFADRSAAIGPSLVGQTIGNYRILGEIGRGGMGVVYEAEQQSPKRPVALKVIGPGIASSSALHRFEHEAQILGRLQHPGIAQTSRGGRSTSAQARSRSSPWSSSTASR